MISTKKTVAFKSLGCKLNQYEIQAIREGLLGNGFSEVKSNEPSDFYVLNTCTVTEGADKQARALVRSFKRLNEDAQVIVTGCYAEASPDQVKALPGVSKVFDNKQKNQIVYHLTGLEETREEESPFFKGGIHYFGEKSKAFVKVQDGCNYFCTFCKIPFVRGRLISRGEFQILDEVRRLVDYGYAEIVLSGVCLGSYGRDNQGENRLVELIEKIIAIPGDFRIRLSSIDPRDTPLAIADLMKTSSKLCQHLHLSLQSGSDVVLNRMRRGYTAAEYEALVEGIRQRAPNIGMTTDLILGFPGEDEASFEETRAFIRRIAFNHIHLFPYSERPKTKAVHLDNKVELPKIQRRMKLLMDDVQVLATNELTKWIGRDLGVLVESKRTENGLLQGFSGEYIKCVFEGPEGLVGRVLKVRGHGIQNNKLLCVLTH